VIWAAHRLGLPDLASSHWVNLLCWGYFVCVRLFSYIKPAPIVTWWGEPVSLRPVWMTNHSPSVYWHCLLGHQIYKTSSPKWPVSSGTLNLAQPSVLHYNAPASILLSDCNNPELCKQLLNSSSKFLLRLAIVFYELNGLPKLRRNRYALKILFPFCFNISNELRAPVCDRWL